MKISNSNNSSGSKQDLNQKQQVINFHLNYVDNQLDVVRTVNDLMEANVPHDEIYEILKDNIDEPLTIKQAIVDLLENCYAYVLDRFHLRIHDQHIDNCLLF